MFWLHDRSSWYNIHSLFHCCIWIIPYFLRNVMERRICKEVVQVWVDGWVLVQLFSGITKEGGCVCVADGATSTYKHTHCCWPFLEHGVQWFNQHGGVCVWEELKGCAEESSRREGKERCTERERLERVRETGERVRVQLAQRSI